MQDHLSHSDAVQMVLDARRKSSAEITAMAEHLRAQDPLDVRCLYDLLRLKADRLIDEERFEDAIRITRELAALAKAHRDVLMTDPAPYLFTAANLCLRLHKQELALEILETLVDEQQSGGISTAWVAETKSWITRLRVEARGLQGSYAKRDTAGSESALPGDSAEYTLVDVFYATDRARTGHAYPSRFYGAGRGPLEVGTATISIPKTHQAGLISKPSIFRLEFSENPVRHVVLQEVAPLDHGDFFARIRAEAHSRARNEIFVYVHGYNTGFEHALKRAAQIAYDINYQGVVAVYSWPSQGTTTGYFADTAAVRLSARRLASFLEDLVTEHCAERIHLIAHSMGSRAVVDALEVVGLRRRAEGQSSQVLDQLLFAAPDVDADVFREMLPDVKATAKRVTLYGSERDWALSASRYIHGDFPRAGQGGTDMVVFKDLDSIDMSAAGDDMLAHNYYAKSLSALLDIATLIWRDSDPVKRYGLVQSSGPHGSSWRFVPDDTRLPLIAQLLSALQLKNIELAEEAIEIARSLGVDLEADEDIRLFVSRILN